MSTDVTRLQVLEHAREIAEKVGAVEHGSAYFEVEDGDTGRAPTPCDSVIYGLVPLEKVCGVCVAGAAIYSALALGAGYYKDEVFWLEEARPFAHAVAAEQFGEPEVDHSHGYPRDLEDRCLTDTITKHGTPYVLAVLDAMIAQDREAND
jgi:hypothetical protein